VVGRLVRLISFRHEELLLGGCTILCGHRRQGRTAWRLLARSWGMAGSVGYDTRGQRDVKGSVSGVLALRKKSTIITVYHICDTLVAS
jgi:hypothetical protein